MRAKIMHQEAGIRSGGTAALPGAVLPEAALSNAALQPVGGAELPVLRGGNAGLTVPPAEGPNAPAPPGGPFAERGAPAKTKRGIRPKTAAAAIVSLTALALIAFIAVHGYAAWRLAYPPVVKLESDPMQEKRLAYSEFLIPASDGVPAVSGWYIPASGNSSRTIVFSHGYGTNREEPWIPMYDLAEAMHLLAYNVILFDYGYASSADRAPATGGVTESRQLVRVINYAKEAGAADIIVWGFSMGAGTALQAALLTDDIAAMILDSTFVAEAGTLALNLSQFSPVAGFPSASLVEAFFPLWAGTRLADIPVDQIKTHSYDMPILLIHGTNDAKAPVSIAETIAANQRHPLSSAWIVPGGQHEMMFRTHTEEYMRRISSFLAGIG